VKRLGRIARVVTDETDDWADRLRANRTEKDRFFAEHRQSPIPPAERDTFDGLSYFDPDPTYRVETTVRVHDDPETVELDTSDDRAIRYRRAVTFEFELDGETHELHGYRQVAEDSREVFVPFRDKTTGQQSYHGGRYMELEPDEPLSDGDRVTLDFNLAYTPFCAFSDVFSCPLAPEENWLDAAIEAGERTP
jgi:uncharacterized protein (DUF1684 family)